MLASSLVLLECFFLLPCDISLHVVQMCLQCSFPPLSLVHYCSASLLVFMDPLCMLLLQGSLLSLTLRTDCSEAILLHHPFHLRSMLRFLHADPLCSTGLLILRHLALKFCFLSLNPLCDACCFC